ncbi:MAG TPA: DNA damage-inducible protein DinB, partial [Flavobacteriaceae bacterium]|nr:DNA damage-inducible protein DinB [Flavobacteriaceae bacterium]
IKELLEHIIDAERIFAYRALRIARNDKTDLSGFEENSYVENANSDSRDYQELLEEFSYVRKSTVFLFKNFSKQVMLQVGTIDGNEITVRAIGYVNSGHLLHHINIIKERYL